MVNVHGGPGMSARSIYRYHNSQLEDHFVVAYWDQRGAGKSFDRSLDPATLTIDRMAADLSELIEVLSAEFGGAPIILLAHSWGTVLSLEHLARRPETVAAYIGIGQVTDQLRSERMGYAWALARADEIGNQSAWHALQTIGPPPWTSEQLLEQRNHLYRLNGFYAEPPSPVRIIRELLATPETGWAELLPMFNAIPWTLGHMWQEFQIYNAFERHQSLNVPVHLMLGRQDRVVAPRLAEAWLARLEAPLKELIWYETAGHMVPAEAPEAFNLDVLRIARNHGLADA
jgi:proline iminopeptidase